MQFVNCLLKQFLTTIILSEDELEPHLSAAMLKVWVFWCNYIRVTIQNEASG